MVKLKSRGWKEIPPMTKDRASALPFIYLLLITSFIKVRERVANSHSDPVLETTFIKALFITF
jgi:hypothetical protein